MRWLPVAYGLLVLGIAAAIMTTPEPGMEELRAVIRATAFTSAVPFLLLYVASSWRRLGPSPVSRWLVANRRYLGLSVAASHFWHLLAIIAFVRAAPAFSIGPVTLVFGGGGFVLLALMAATSTDGAQRALGRAWGWLHTTGVHVLWLDFLFTYMGRATVAPFHAVMTVLFAAALGVRVAARRRDTPARTRLTARAGRARPGLEGGTPMGAAVQIDPTVEQFVKAPVRKMLIGGKWVEAASGKTFDTVNPADGTVLARVAAGDTEDVDRAARAARKAFDEGPWSRIAPAERERLLFRVADLIEKHAKELAQLETLDNGKSIFESTNVDIPQAAATFRYYGGWVNKIAGETSATDPTYFHFTLREPVGVCGQIIPWNFPLLMAAWKLGPALACGNTVVLKPAEQTPLTALRLGELLQEAGLPDGVVNIVPGYGETAGAAIVRHPAVDKIAFTGSTDVGKLIHRETAATLKRVSLELGGKSPNIVFADADVEEAVKGALTGVFFNQGEVCCAGTRLFVEEKLHDEFAQAVAKHASGMKQGPGLEAGVQVGPLVSQEQLERVTGYFEIGKKEGAKALCGGERNTNAGLDKGYFVKPTVFTGVRNDMRIAQEEIFGPVVAVIPFKDETDAVFQGNSTLYGLAAGVWTKDVSKAHRVARAIRAGTVWINCYNVFDVVGPFGGYKQSGYGRELSRYALDLYTQVKSVWLKV